MVFITVKNGCTFDFKVVRDFGSIVTVLLHQFVEFQFVEFHFFASILSKYFPPQELGYNVPKPLFVGPSSFIPQTEVRLFTASMAS